MSNPDYCATFDIPSIFRGDTLDGFAVAAKKSQQTHQSSLFLFARRSLIRSGKKIADWPHTIDPVTGKITFAQIDGDVTATWRAGSYAYDVEWTTANGRKAHILKRRITLIEDRSKCQ